MPINQLYDTWKMRIMELSPGQRITQIRAFAWLIIGIYLSRSVCMSRVACKIPGEAKLTMATALVGAGNLPFGCEMVRTDAAMVGSTNSQSGRFI
jgi:hypothetical protein